MKERSELEIKFGEKNHVLRELNKNISRDLGNYNTGMRKKLYKKQKLKSV